MIELALANAALTLVVGLAGAALVVRLRTLRARLVGLALVATCSPIAGLTGSGVVMLGSGHDLVLLASAGGASLAALVGAWLVARTVLAPVQGLGAAARAMGSGDLAARATGDGPAELAALATSFNAMAADVEKLFDARQELVTFAGHDLRAPLTALQAMIEAVEDGVAPPERYLPQMRERVAALSAIVDDLLDVARLGAGRIEVGRDPTPLAPVIAASLGAVREQAACRRITLDASDIAADCPIACAPAKATRMVTNLLANALRHTPDGGTIAVSARRSDGAVAIAVDDSGPGFAPGSEARAFEPFWRGDQARSDGGAGLGLTITRGLAEAHGGTVEIRRSHLGGARVVVSLPAGR